MVKTTGNQKNKTFSFLTPTHQQTNFPYENSMEWAHEIKKKKRIMSKVDKKTSQS